LLAENFRKFIQEHTILIHGETGNATDDDDHDFIPTAGNATLRRVPCYGPLLQRIKDRHYFDEESHTFIVEVPLSELVAWDGVRGMDMAQRAVKNTMRYHDIFSKVLDETLQAMITTHTRPARDTIDILHEQRLAQQAQRQAQRTGTAGNDPGGGGVMNDQQNHPNANPGGATEDFPPLLMRRYELRILPMGRKGTQAPFHNQVYPKVLEGEMSEEGVSLRFIRSRSMGRLVTMKGMIVRASDVKPINTVATYTCDACGCEVYQVLANQREFLPQRVCPSAECTGKPGSRVDTLHLQTRGSKFVKFQELKLQELPNQVPMGHIPRSMSVHCRGELTRLATPGDVVTIDGIFLPQKIAESGYRAMQAGLVSTTYLDAHNLVVHKKSFDESAMGGMSEEEAAKMQEAMDEVSNSDDPLGALSAGIAPEIFGHEDIKRSLLLQLVGGCTRKLPDGMRIRGDINICLMGDPGVAKSQLLKHVASIAPRGVYTTGKGSSGVGLTAAVTKDMATGEMALEGGALVLADRGICAIDEFDKMDESDRTAIHEVMEQQTVSIAKAGIVATLNARAAVLAAANPLYGRYNRKKSLSENINLPNSLLSRFDLMFLILDVADHEKDTALARHVTFVHQNEGLGKKKSDEPALIEDEDEEPEQQETKVTPKVLREYIARARKYLPFVTKEVAPYICEAYVSLRQESRGQKGQNDQTAMTARQLLSILRLSQAIARLRFSDYVAREDIDEAIRLTHMSKASLDEHERTAAAGTSKARGRGDDVTSKIFEIIRTSVSLSGNKEQVELSKLEPMILRKGFTQEQLEVCLKEYEDLEIIQVNSNRTIVTVFT
jgi:DNA replication licensing factor MCM7